MKALFKPEPRTNRESCEGTLLLERDCEETGEYLAIRHPRKSELHCCKPIAFWCLNHLLEEVELKRQIEELSNAGFGGFFMHPRAGLLTPYGSAEWFRMLKVCINEARRVGLKAWLYDEDPFPSGMGGGFVTLGRPQLRASSLVPVIRRYDHPGQINLDLPSGELVGAYLIQETTITRIDESAGLVRTDWSSVQLANHSYYPPFSSCGAPHWRANTTGQHLRITLKVDTAPVTIVGFVREYIVKDPWGEYADLLNPEAVEIFLKLTHKAYRSRFEEAFGVVVPGIFTDEPKVMGAFPWSESLAPIFHQISGQELYDVLPHLVLDIDQRSEWRRWAYREAISRAFKVAFIDRIEAFCSDSGLHFVGHISPEEDPIGQAVFTPGLMNWIGGMGIAGTDLIGSDIGDERHKLLHLGPKLASSAAHTRGKNLVLCEAFAVTDWVLDTAWMGKAINWLYALGVNMLSPHGQFYSIDGPRKREAPPSEFFQASYWEHFPAISAYVENLSRVLREGCHEAPVALYYPSEAFMAWAPSLRHSALLSEEALAKSEALRAVLGELIDFLLVSGYDFDLVDVEALRQAQVCDGRLVLHEESYAVLVLPGGCLCSEAAARMEEFTALELPLLSLQEIIPVLGGAPYRAARACVMERLPEQLREICPPVFQAAGRLIGHKRVTSSGALLFLVNNGDTTFSGKVDLDFEGPYEIIHLQDGTVNEVGNSIDANLEPGQGLLVRRARSRQQAHTVRSNWKTLFALSGEWTCHACSDNTLILQEFRVLEGSLDAGLQEDSFLSAPVVDLLSPGLESFPWSSSEVLSFWTTFECRNGLHDVSLVRDGQLGPPSNSAFSENYRFFVNGHPAGPFERRRRYDPWNFECEIGRFLCEGRNSLVMEQTLTPGTVRCRAPYDAIRLFGNFRTEFPFGRSTPAVLTPRAGKLVMNTLRLAEEMGHSQYGGILEYSRIVWLPEIPPCIALRFETFRESAEIFVNGVSCGVLWQRPYRLELDPRLFSQGENLLEIRCSTSPANYLQGLRRPAGLSGEIFLETR